MPFTTLEDILGALAGGIGHEGVDDQSSSNDDQLTIKDGELIINEDGDDLDFRIEASGVANALVVQGSDGNVGIGTLTPDTQLEVTKASANAEVTISCYDNTEATTPLLTLRKGDNTEASPALVDNNAVLGTISFQGHDGVNFEQGAKIEARVDGSPGSNDLPTELTFWTTPDDSATALERMTITPAGAVQITGTSPARVTRDAGSGTTGFYNGIELAVATTGTPTGDNLTAGLRMLIDGTDVARIGGQVGADGSAYGNLIFLTATNAAPTEKMRIRANGQTCVQEGTAAAPSLSFIGDENTGLYNVSGNRIGFTTAGSLKAAVTSSGYFYVGTTGAGDMAGTDGFFSVKHSANALAAYITSSTATHIIAEFMSDHGGAEADQLRIMCDGDIETDGSVGALSDERLKTVLEARDYYEDLRKLEVVNFHLVKRVKRNHVYDDDGEQIGEPTYEIVDREEPSKKHLGLVAQQVEEHIPGLVKMGADGVRVLKYSVLTPMLLQAFQKLANKAETLEAKVEALEERIAALESA